MSSDFLVQLAFSTLTVFLFAVSLLGVALGLGLMLRSSAALPFIAFMNRWVSTRQALTPLEAPVPVPRMPAGSRALGLLILAIGAYAAVALIQSFDVQRVALLFKIDPRFSLGSIALEALKWLLVLGSVAAAVAGILLLVSPGAWRALEQGANRWYSTAQWELAADRPYLSLERLVEAQPQAAGAVILALSATAAMASGLLLLG